MDNPAMDVSRGTDLAVFRTMTSGHPASHMATADVTLTVPREEEPSTSSGTSRAPYSAHYTVPREREPLSGTRASMDRQKDIKGKKPKDREPLTGCNTSRRDQRDGDHSISHILVPGHMRVVREREQRQWQVFMHRWRYGLVLAIGYLTSLVSFMLFYHIRVLPPLPYPLGTNLLDYNPSLVPKVWWPTGDIFILALWGISFLRKLLLSIIARSKPWWNIPSSDQGPAPEDNHPICACCLAILIILYHVFFGVWCGWANNFYCGYIISEPLLLILGLTVYLFGEGALVIGSLYHVIKKKEEGHYFISGRYACDLLSSVGFALVSFTLPACILVICRLVIILYTSRFQTRAVCKC